MASRYGPSGPYPEIEQVISRGNRSRSASAPSPSRSAAPGAKFCTNTSARSSRRSTVARVRALRSSAIASFERFSHTKWLDSPCTALS